MGQSIDDLSQVAAFGLLQAIDRYDPGRGERFVSFALPTILGELRRHFRDHAWGIHVPRRLQELRLSINHATDAMTQRLHRAPTVGELAEHLDASCEEVREAMVAAQGYLPASLSQPVGIDGSTELSDMIGASDPNLDHLEQRESVKRLLLTLPDREKRVLCYRFFGNMTQAQVAEALGISQMHVSRLQSRALGRLRGGLFAQG
jgi:RNA polymerase sigma-B factor